MCKKWLCVVVALSLSSIGLSATSYTWASTGDTDWHTASNWDLNGVPLISLSDQAWFKTSTVDCVINAPASAKLIQVGHGVAYDGTLIINDSLDLENVIKIGNNGGIGAVELNASGSINSGWIGVGQAGTGLFTMNGGSITLDTSLKIGSNGGTGTMNMFDGTITADRMVVADGVGTFTMTGGLITLDGGDVMNLAFRVLADGDASLDGGIINSLDLQVETGGILDITGGTLVLDGNVTAELLDHIMNGRITAYDGAGTVHAYYDGSKTVLKGVDHDMGPIPASQDIDVWPGLSELSWTNPNPNQIGEEITCDVYFGDSEPNILSGQPSLDLNQIVFGESVSSVAVPVSMTANTTYYWKVDCFDSSPGSTIPALSVLYTFTTNHGKLIDAGEDTYTWLTGSSLTLGLDGTLTEYDSQNPVVDSVLWTVVSKPGGAPDPTFTPSDSQIDTSVTLTVTGNYVLQLEASGEGFNASDTVDIYLGTDSCDAAKAQPTYVDLNGNVDGDCDVDLADLRLIVLNWLASNNIE